jgi:dipeptidyl aminopeptidase/acylaminoacyl peptidase
MPMRNFLLLLLMSALSAFCPVAAGDRPLTFKELMQFQKIYGTVIADNGRWVACEARPDRGDGELQVLSSDGLHDYRVPRGSAPQIGADGRFVAATILPDLEAVEAADHEPAKDGKNGGDGEEDPRNGMVILDTTDGSVRTEEEVESFSLSKDGRFLVYRHYKPEEDESEPVGDKEASEETGEVEQSEEKESEVENEETGPEGQTQGETIDPPEAGSKLVVRDLHTKREVTTEFVSAYALDETSRFLAYATATPTGESNGVFLVDLTNFDAAHKPLRTLERGYFGSLRWAKDRSLLAFLAAGQTGDGEEGDAALWTWKEKGKAKRTASSSDASTGWTLPFHNQLEFSRDGQRLFFGFKPAEPGTQDGEEDTVPFDPYDLEAVIERRQVDVWHWNDPRIITNQKERWDEHEKHRTYRAVAHLNGGKIVPLADSELPEVLPSTSARYALGIADTPYLKEITWVGSQFDLYRVDLQSGERQKVATRLTADRALSPDGRFVLYFKEEHWHLFDGKTGSSRNLTKTLQVPFADEDHDYPSPRTSYGFGGWVGRDQAVLIYDKFDIWRFPLTGSEPTCITGNQGRADSSVFRVLKLDKDQEFLETKQALLLSAYHDRKKHRGFYIGSANGVALKKVVEEPARYSFLMKAEDSNQILFTRETYNQFPDLRTAGLTLDADRRGEAFTGERRLTDINPQLADFAWGQPELVEWTSADGVPLQGILIRPGNYEPGRRYPVLVYYYRFFTQRLYGFNDPVVNHRPSFPMYASNGYAVFLPDIRFKVGTPGFSATKALVPGVQKLVDLGIADPHGIGLHGHSWSGYQTAFVVTQTDIFKAAVAGAPVSNMTSAYSGIRLGTGLARQFQYEQSQSRIGGSLWEYPERYIENSPVFFADRINTPLLIQAGDRDEAVPWQQSIEMYLAMRRLGKDCIFLQYRDEPHHLKKYPNKLDYSIKMKQFFDHHLKGQPAPDWMTEGVPYKGE